MSFFSRSLRLPRSLACVAFTAVLLAGCQTMVGNDITPGESQQAVRANIGEPFAIYSNSEGAIWFYNTNRATLQRERVTFNADGNVTSHTQAWTRKHFDAIKPSSWTADELLKNFGPPLSQKAPDNVSLFSKNNPPPGTTTNSENSDARTLVWQYGFMESQRYFTVNVTVLPTGLVSNVVIQRDNRFYQP